MRQPNIKRLEKVAKLLEQAADLLDRVTDDENPHSPSDAYYLRVSGRELYQMKRNIEAVAKVEREYTENDGI